jgi:hypothetical protein
MASFIKIHRKIMMWEWYHDSRMVHLFLHLLVTAAWRDGRYQGKEVKRGQVITSVDDIMSATGLSTQRVRTGLDRLEDSGEITRTTTNQYSIITIRNYNSYQVDDRTDQQTEQQTDNKPITNEQQTTVQNQPESQEIDDTKKVKKVKKVKNKDTTAPSPAEAGLEPIVKIPTNRFDTVGEEVPVYQPSVDLWQDTFPGIDVAQELKKARTWAVNNKAKRKTAGGMMKFLNGWMERAQNSGRGNGQPSNGGEQVKCSQCVVFDVPTATCGKNDPPFCKHFSRK